MLSKYSIKTLHPWLILLRILTGKTLPQIKLFIFDNNELFNMDIWVIGTLNRGYAQIKFSKKLNI